MDQIPCPDGYLLDAHSPLADAHHVLNTYLVRVEEVGWEQSLKELNTLRDKALKVRIWKALLERLDWRRTRDLSSPYFGHLRSVLYSIEKWKIAPSERDLLDVIQASAPVCGCVPPYTPVAHVMAFVEEQGLTPALSSAMREYDAIVREKGLRINQTSYQMFTSRMDMLAWWDEWNAIDPKRCWSEQVRADFRAMQEPEKQNWRKLLHSIQGDEGTRPAPKWLRNAQSLVEAIGPAQFQSRLVHWFEPLRPGAVQRLSREGSFILRAFIWLAESLSDAELTARVGAFHEVQFKPKANGEKVIRAAAQAIGAPDPTVKPAKPLPGLDELTARALSIALSPAGSPMAATLAGRVRIEGTVIYIRGDLDSYRVHISTGAIFRDRDGMRIHVAPSRMPGTALEFGGIGELLSNILVLADDSKHPTRYRQPGNEVGYPERLSPT